MKSIIGLVVFLLVIRSGFPQERQETVKKEITFSSASDRTLWIDNISGNIKVEGYNGTSASIEVNKKIEAKSQTELDKYWNQVKLITDNSKDTIEVYLDGLCDCHCDHHHYIHGNGCEYNIDFSFDFAIKVPFKTNLLLSTVNNGEINVDHVTGTFYLRNVNGGITMNEVSGPTDVHTINGDVIIKYSENPVNDSKYYTLNGKLNVYYLPDLSAEMSFKSFNGEFYTNFNISDNIQSRLVTNDVKSNSTTYKIDERTAVKVGKGGIKLDFETFNGNIFIRKKENHSNN